jgi:hypothetical protein
MQTSIPFDNEITLDIRTDIEVHLVESFGKFYPVDLHDSRYKYFKYTKDIPFVLETIAEKLKKFLVIEPIKYDVTLGVYARKSKAFWKPAETSGDKVLRVILNLDEDELFTLHEVHSCGHNHAGKDDKCKKTELKNIPIYKNSIYVVPFESMNSKVSVSSNPIRNFNTTITKDRLKQNKVRTSKYRRITIVYDFYVNSTLSTTSSMFVDPVGEEPNLNKSLTNNNNVKLPDLSKLKNLKNNKMFKKLMKDMPSLAQMVKNQNAEKTGKTEKIDK